MDERTNGRADERTSVQKDDGIAPRYVCKVYRIRYLSIQVYEYTRVLVHILRSVFHVMLMEWSCECHACERTRLVTLLFLFSATINSARSIAMRAGQCAPKKTI